MTAALHNLASRAEIISKGLSSEILLAALLKADGLVNKAKSALLSPSSATDLISPAKDARVDRLSLQISPEKVQHEKRENQDHEELAKTLGNLSATLRYVSTPATKEDDYMKVGAQSSLADAQLQRIKENRERALARKAQILLGN